MCIQQILIFRIDVLSVNNFSNINYLARFFKIKLLVNNKIENIQKN